MFESIRKQHSHLTDRELLLTILFNQLLILQKQDTLMTKPEFLAAIADFKTEIGTVSGKVDVLESKINNSTDVDPDIVAAFQDLKSSMDALNTKADNTPAQAGE